MTRTFKRIIIVGIVLIALAAGAVALVLSGGCTQNGGALDAARNDTVNALVDASGVKDRVDAELRSHAGEIAEATGIPQAVVDNAIESLAIPDWQVVTLPEDAEETATFTFDYEDESVHVPLEVTTYDNPGVVTLSAYGQTLTMQVPESAQTYLELLDYLDASQ